MASELKLVPVNDVCDSKFRMRETIEQGNYFELRESIRRDGVLVPVLLQSTPSGYEVVAGHRRFKAACEIGHSCIPAHVVDMDEKQGWHGALAENMFRQDLSAIEEAAAIKDCMDSTGYDVHTMAVALGRSQVWVKERLELIEWPTDVAGAVHAGVLSVAAARNLAAIDDEVHRTMLVAYAVENGATARVTAAWLQAWQIGEIQRKPQDIEAEPGKQNLPPIEPHTPCIICTSMQKMTDLRYPPVCPNCVDVMIDMARRLRMADSSDPAAGQGVQ